MLAREEEHSKRDYKKGSLRRLKKNRKNARKTGREERVEKEIRRETVRRVHGRLEKTEAEVDR